MSIQEINFASANGRDSVRAWAYTPLGTPRAIIQLIHGFGEHSRRYLHMISKFQAAGFVVYADDHIGHGKTGFDIGSLGDPHSIDYNTYIKDEHQLHDIATQAYPNIPYCVFGHSWGSMIARGYAAQYGQDISALILCGVVSQMKGCDLALNNESFNASYDNDPYQSASEWMPEVFLNMTERFESVSSPNDWIANDNRVVQDHAADPFNTFDVTLQLLWDFVQLYGFIENNDWAKLVPSNIPVYLIAGDQDPCGNYGEGLYHTANMLAQNGNPVSVKAYSGYRHEIHNELDLRDEVEDGVVNFLNQTLS